VQGCLTFPRSTTLQGWGEEGRDSSCSHTHYFLTGMAISIYVLTPYVETVSGWAGLQPTMGGQGSLASTILVVWDWVPTCRSGTGAAIPHKGIVRWSLPYPLPRQVRQMGFSTFASSSQHPAGGNQTTAPHHSWWNSGGYFGHPSWSGYPPHGQTPYWGYHQGYTEPYPYGYQAPGAPNGPPGNQKFPRWEF
jgi:hypothetical protein